MKRAAALVLALLAVCLYAGADPAPANGPDAQAQDFIRFGRHDLAHGLGMSALYYFSQAIAHQPNWADAWVGRARALDMLGRFDEAKTANDKALGLAPSSPEIWATQGKILFDERQYNDALIALNKSFSLGNTDTTAYRWKGQTLDSLGRHEEALNAYEKAKPPYQPYHGGITRMTSGGPKIRETSTGSNSTEAPEKNDEAPAPGQPGGYSGYPEQELAPEPVTSYYQDYGSYSYVPSYYGGHMRGGRHREDGPKTVAPYRGVEPLFQQGVVPQYWQGVTPPADFNATPDYHGAAGDPFISDRFHGSGGGRHGGGHGGRGGGHGGH